MKHLLLIAAAFVAVSVVSCSQATGPDSPAVRSNSSANAAQSYNEPVSAQWYDPCCDETIDLSGMIHITYTNNGIHANYNDVVGTGSNGNTYHGGGQEQETINFTNGATEETLILKVVMTSAGGCQFTVTYNIHVTINANGTVTVDNETYDFSC